MMQGNTEIAELYDEGIITGETYLYCVENNIDVIQDITDLHILNADGVVLGELTEIKRESKEYCEVSQDSIVEDLDCVERYITDDLRTSFRKFCASCDTRTGNVLSKAAETLGGEDELISLLLDAKSQSSLPCWKNAGRKTIHQIFILAQRLQRKQKEGDNPLCLHDASDLAVEIPYDCSIQFIEPLVLAEIDQMQFNSKMVFDSIYAENSYKVSDFYNLLVNTTRPLTRVVFGEKRIATLADIETLRNSIYGYYEQYHEILGVIWDFCESDGRTRHVLQKLLMDSGCMGEFIAKLTSYTKSNIPLLKNAGHKTIKTILAIAQHVRDELNPSHDVSPTKSQHISQSVISEKVLDISGYETLILSKIESMPTRARNILNNLLESCNGSCQEFCNKIFDVAFSFATMRNAGAKTLVEIDSFRSNLRTIVTTLSLEEVHTSEKRTRWQSLLNISNAALDELQEKEEELHRFPFFFAIQKCIENLPIRERTILQKQIDIYNDQKLANKSEVGKALNISGERVRQIRSRVFASLTELVTSISKAEDIAYYTLDVVPQINMEEATNFQDNFIYWVIASCSKLHTIIGNIENVFFNPYGLQVNLNVVPTVLAESFDFYRFIDNFECVYREKRTTAEELNLQSYCIRFFKGSIQIALLEDVVYECKKIVHRLYDCTSFGDVIMLESNAYRGLGEISEEILREHGSPMTADEIYAVLLERYPNQRCKGANSLVGSIHNNSNILPMGRSRTYSLKEWNLGTKRGGTIREFAEECILMQPDRIASLEDIGNYVRQFRETSSNSSIQANLMLEASGKFALFTKDDQKYIGFSGREYDSCYIPAEESMVIVRSFETSTRLLIQFIEEHGRYPFSGGEDVEESEKRLWRFLRNVRYRCKNGTGTFEDYEFIKYLESAYPYQEIPRNEYKWREMHSTICKILLEYKRDGLTSTEQQWCYKYLRMLKQGQLEDWQVPLMVKLQSLYA